MKSCEDPAGKAKLQEKYAQSAKRLQEQNAAYTKFCADNDLNRTTSGSLLRAGIASAASTASAAVRKELDKYKKYHYNKDGTIVVTDDWTSKAKPHVPGSIVLMQLLIPLLWAANNATEHFLMRMVGNAGRSVMGRTGIRKGIHTEPKESTRTTLPGMTTGARPERRVSSPIRNERRTRIYCEREGFKGLD